MALNVKKGAVRVENGGGKREHGGKVKEMNDEEDEEIVKVPEERLQRLQLNSNIKSARQLKLK
jgi:hypothetical protein